MPGCFDLTRINLHRSPATVIGSAQEVDAHTDLAATFHSAELLAYQWLMLPVPAGAELPIVSTEAHESGVITRIEDGPRQLELLKSAPGKDLTTATRDLSGGWGLIEGGETVARWTRGSHRLRPRGAHRDDR